VLKPRPTTTMSRFYLTCSCLSWKLNFDQAVWQLDHWLVTSMLWCWSVMHSISKRGGRGRLDSLRMFNRIILLKVYGTLKRGYFNLFFSFSVFEIFSYLIVIFKPMNKHVLLLLLQDIYRALQYVKNTTQRWKYLFTTCQNSLCPWSKSHRNQVAVELNKWVLSCDLKSS